MQKRFELRGSLERTLPPPHSFGQSIDVNDNYVVVGADDLSMHNTKECGGIYIFDKKYNELQYFYTDRDKSFYGWDVAITDDNTIIVGADDEDNESRYNGSAFVFKKCETGGFYMYKKLFAEKNMQGCYYGYAVDCNNKHVAISAPSYQFTSQLSEAYVYIYDLENFELCHTLTPDHPKLPSIYSSFGCNIKFSDKYLVISEHTYKKVYIYDANTFELLNEISGLVATSMDLCGEYLVCGDPKKRTITIYHIDEHDLILVQRCQDISNFGYKVAINNNILAVASNRNTEYLYDNVVMGTNSKGKIFIYEYKDYMKAELLDIKDEFYQSMKFHKDKLYCGNPIANDLYGVVNVYTT
jgi:WD40 repeat protein